MKVQKHFTFLKLIIGSFGTNYNDKNYHNLSYIEDKKLKDSQLNIYFRAFGILINEQFGIIMQSWNGELIFMCEQITIEELKNKGIELEKRASDLKQRIANLAVGKLTEQRRPFTHWLSVRRVSNDRRMKLFYAFNTLSEKLKGKKITPAYTEISLETQAILYMDAIPTFEEITLISNDILGIRPTSINKKVIVSMLICMLRQGSSKELCEHLLKEVGLDPNKPSNTFI
jgi:uncharacterized protein YbcI